MKNFNKDYYRKIAKEKLACLKTSEKIKYDKEIFSKIINSNEYIIANEIFTYFSFDNEVSTIELINYSLKQNKKVFVPKILNNKKELKVGKISSISDLKIGKYNILEPPDEKVFYKYEFDILFIPGLCFDYKGIRIGRGKGYFDIFLAKVKGLKIGLCYSFQVFDKLPSDEHDIKMDKLITEKEFITFTWNLF